MPLRHRFLERADDVAAEIDVLLHRGVKLRPREVVGFFDAVARDLRTIHDERNIAHILGGAVDARLDLHRKPQLISADALVDVLNARRDVLAPRGDGEMVVVEAREQIILERLAQEIRHVAQELVALRAAVALVETLKIFDVKIQEGEFPRPAFLHTNGDMPHELHHIQQSRDLAPVVITRFFLQNIILRVLSPHRRVRERCARIPPPCRAGSFRSFR